MRKKPQKEINKPRFCCDNNLSFRLLNKHCNRFGTYHSTNTLIKKPNPTDPEVIKFCDKNNYHIITHDKRNFKDYEENTRVGIFYIGSVDPQYWLDDFIRYMKYNPKHKDSCNKTINIEGGKTKVITRNKSKLP